jgi:type III restriction enzyme
MKIHFEPELTYQQQAIAAVCDLFQGQDICRSSFTVTAPGTSGAQQSLGFAETETGVANKLALLDTDILSNLHAVQLRNGVAPAERLTSGDFTVEMETGTGKTYVYLRTIMELHKRFGFTKFVVVVPSVAIKEGVYKSLEMTEDHFHTLYDGVPYEYFIYDSAKPQQVRSFATSASIQIMVMTIGAIRLFATDEEVAERKQRGKKKPAVNVMYTPNEKTGGEKPIYLLEQTRPVVIIDEPQSVDRNAEGKGRAAIERLKPLCTLRYSATHVDPGHKQQMVFRLDAVDAYEQELVKKIEVASVQVESAHNRPYIKLLEISNKKGQGIKARVELDVQQGNAVRRKERWVFENTDLAFETERPAVYADCRVGEINAATKTLTLYRPGHEHRLAIGESYGDVNPDDLKRLMIRRTIKAHLDKEVRLRPLGIKVLSLFFVDRVEHYRRYLEDGTPTKGKYADIFEQEYKQLIRHSAYATLFEGANLNADVTAVHDGYFSKDKKGVLQDTSEGRAEDRENAERAYNLIMKDKERLLSFETPLRFLFSHSALREGWDNPNVFQICALRDINTEMERRQTIGRGLRLCVNQAGDRVRGFAINRLTVVATEGYEAFAENLQKEIERETGLTFGLVKADQFATIPVTGADGQTVALGQAQSEAIRSWLLATGYIDAHGKVQDKLRTALKDRTFALAPELGLAHVQEPVQQLLRKLAGKLEVANADDHREKIPTREAVLHSEEFKALWDRIKARTTYRVAFDADKLVQDCIKALNKMPAITRARAITRVADIAIGRDGVTGTLTATGPDEALNERVTELPDLLTELQNRTQLTRKSLVQLLTADDNERLDDFSRNPQEFIDLAAEAINATKRHALVDGIRYQRIGEQAYYAQECLEKEELSGYLRNMLAAKKSVHESVVFDSAGVEQNFAKALELAEEVKVYAKLPAWFRIPTPLGSYNPDWAVLVEKAGQERLYFVAETKGTNQTGTGLLRGIEEDKIHCGRAHFAALAEGQENPVRYEVVQTLDDLLKLSMAD